jgi:hypothetical protein
MWRRLALSFEFGMAFTTGCGEDMSPAPGIFRRDVTCILSTIPYYPAYSSD